MVSKDFINEINENVNWVSRSNNDNVCFVINCDYIPVYHGRNASEDYNTYLSGAKQINNKVLYSVEQLINYFNDILEQEKSEFEYYHGNGDNRYDRFVGISIEYGGIIAINTSNCEDTEFSISEIHYNFKGDIL